MKLHLWIVPTNSLTQWHILFSLQKSHFESKQKSWDVFKRCLINASSTWAANPFPALRVCCQKCIKVKQQSGCGGGIKVFLNAVTWFSLILKWGRFWFSLWVEQGDLLIVVSRFYGRRESYGGRGRYRLSAKKRDPGAVSKLCRRSINKVSWVAFFSFFLLSANKTHSAHTAYTTTEK